MQLSIFEEQPQTKLENVHWHLYVDGASRNNPGPAGAGLCLFKDGVLAIEKGFFLGIKTNNQAEYLALILGVFCAKQHLKPGQKLSIFADSELLVRQMQGAYKVKNEDLKKLQHAAYKMLMLFDYTIQHVMRSENEHADAMANHGIDNKIKVSSDFLTLMQTYGISL